jgi:hypothetical protein
MTEKQAPSQAPLLLVLAGLLIWSAFQTFQLYRERTNLQSAHSNQDQVIANAKKMRNQLDAIAASTKRLADQGNPNAQLVVQQLAKNGININPNAQPSSASK